MKKVLLSLLILSPLLSVAQPFNRHFEVFFPEGRSDSPESLPYIRAFADSSLYFRIHSIGVNGFASPSGNLAYNVRLSESRSKTVAHQLRALFPKAALTRSGNGEDWSRLQTMLLHSAIEDKDVILSVVGSSVFDVIGAKQALKLLDGGRVYRELCDGFFPSLRRVDVDVVFSARHFSEFTSSEDSFYGRTAVVPLPSGTALLGVVTPLEQDPGVTAPPSGADSHVSVSGTKRIPFAIRSNLLMPLLNVGVEFPLKGHLSAGVDYFFPWFGHDRENSSCLELQGVSAECRYWFKPSSLSSVWGLSFTGHSVALGVVACRYDFENDYHGRQGEAYGVYVDYLYSKYLSEHLRLELCLGVGYAFSPWRDYQVYEGRDKLIRVRPVLEHYDSYFGPMKASVALSFPIVTKRKYFRS